MSETIPDFGPLFDFSNADLQANAAGRLTPHQIENLKHRRRNQMLTWLFMSVVGLFILATTFPPLVAPGSNDYFVFLMVLLVFSAAEWALAAEFRAIQADIQAGVVESMKGRPHYYDISSRRGQSYCLSIDGTRFNLTRKQYEVMRQQISKVDLQIYYTPRTKTLVSVKRIE